ncbi:MAG: TonB-dependent receptor [Bacteroidota bacterium]|nr:TonB-dependent receptor [Bacteroidota bacterium]
MGFPRAYQLSDDGNSRNIDIPRQVTDHFKAIINTNILLNENWLELDLGYQRNFRREESNPHVHGKGPRPEGILALGLDLQTISGNARYHHTISNKLNSIYGLQFQYQENSISGFEFLLPNYNSGNIGAYSYQELSLNNITTINAGLRLDHGYRNIDGFAEPIYSDLETVVFYYPRVNNFNRQFTNLSGATGISFYPHHNFNSKLNFGSSFRMPTAPEMSSNGMHHGNFRYEMGDSTLRSERGYQVDLNLTYHTREFHLSLTPFYNYFNNFIYLGPTAQFPPEIQLPEGGRIRNPGGQAYQFQQDNAMFWGAEASIEYHIFKELHLRSAIEYVWNINLTTQLGLPFTPPFSILNEVTYDLPLKSKKVSNLHIGLLAQSFADQNMVDRNEKRTGGYTLFNFESGFDINILNIPFHFVFTVQNVTNKVYLNHLSRYRLINLPEQGRNFTFMVKIPINVVTNNNLNKN